MLNLEKEHKKQAVGGDSERKVLRLNQSDNVLIALRDLPAGAKLEGAVAGGSLHNTERDCAGT